MSWLVTFCGLLQRHPLDHLGERRRGGDGAGAAEGLEFRLLDPFVLIEFEGKLEGVPAGDGTDLGDAVRIFHLPDIPGVEKMFSDLVRVFPHNSPL